MHPLANLDLQYVWHPFTQMRDWMRREPIVITSGKGAVLRDVHGREYLDANASIWTNLHGHQNPAINRAIRSQLSKIAHSSALGLANEPASLVAKRLVRAATIPASRANPPARKPKPGHRDLTRVFYSDDGSTAIEVALKLSYEYARRTGRKQPRFLSLSGAYHGDTVGAVSAGHISLFHKAYSGLLFKTGKVMAPYCYRCPFNRAKPERADARAYRKCHFECAGKVEEAFARGKRQGAPYTAMIVEPRMQGAAGMIPQPHGWLPQIAEIVQANGAQLIADEVMTGFGRTGITSSELQRPHSTALFASIQEGVQPDFLALAKGMTGGYLPMAATLTTEAVFEAFLADYSEFKTFFHGHSFTGNQLGAAAALASIGLLENPAQIERRLELQRLLAETLQDLWQLENVGDIRQAGLVAGIELVQDWRARRPFPLEEQAGIRVCEAMAARGVLTRPVGNVIVIMPPYCTTNRQLKKIISATAESIAEVFSHQAG